MYRAVQASYEFSVFDGPHASGEVLFRRAAADCFAVADECKGRGGRSLGEVVWISLCGAQRLVQCASRRGELRRLRTV